MVTRCLRVMALGAVIAAAILLGPTSMAAEAAAPVYLVDDDGAQCPTAAYTNTGYANPLQAAIDDAIANNVKTISVCGGVYSSVAIWNAGTLTVKAFDPADRPQIVAPASNDWEVVQVVNSVKVTLDGLLITRTLSGDVANGIMYGVTYYASGGTIQNNIIRDIGDPVFGSAHGEAILVDNQSTTSTKMLKVLVKGNMIDRFESMGIVVRGRVSATVTGNVLNGNRGSGTQPYYGILVTGSSTHGSPRAKIAQNTISETNNAVYLREVSGISISGNVFSNSGWSGVFILSNCWDGESNANKNKISGNTFLRSAQYDINLDAEEQDPTSQCDPRVDQTQISKNVFVAADAYRTTAIWIVLYQYGSAYTAGAAGTKVTGNTAYGYAHVSQQSAGVVGTVIQGNTLVKP